MSLKNYTCVCNNINLTNINGYCLCPKGSYINYSTNYISLCVDCPKNCYTCSIQNNVLKCSACNVNGTHRQAISESDCPCIDGYNEVVPKT